MIVATMRSSAGSPSSEISSVHAEGQTFLCRREEPRQSSNATGNDDDALETDTSAKMELYLFPRREDEEMIQRVVGGVDEKRVVQ